MRGEGNNYKENFAAKETKTLKDVLLNKWTALISILAVVLGISLKLEDGEKQEKTNEIKNELKLEKKDLPDNPKEIQEAIKAINHLNELVKKRGRVSHVKESEGQEEQKPDEACLTGEERVVKDDPEYMIVEKPKCVNGRQISGEYITYDKTLPDEETATDENYKLLSDYFKKNLPNVNIERKSPWEYKVSEDVNDKEIPKWQQFMVEVRVETDGTYTVGHVTNFDESATAQDSESLLHIIKDKMEILHLYSEWVNAGQEDDDKTAEDFFSFLKEKGWVPAEDAKKVDDFLKKIGEKKN